MAIDSTPGVVAAPIAGGGLSVLPDFVVSEPLGNGQLVVLCPEWSLPSGGIYTVCPNARFRPPKVTVFVDMLINHLQAASSASRLMGNAH